MIVYEVDAGDGFTISDDATRLDIDLIHNYLSQEAYWAIGRPRAAVVRTIEHSVNFGVFDRDGHQVGYARVFSDFAIHAYICDVFILPQYRGRGLSKQLMAAMLAHPELKDVRKWLLKTQDAHGLYRQFGFAEPAIPEWSMERINDGPFAVYDEAGNGG